MYLSSFCHLHSSYSKVRIFKILYYFYYVLKQLTNIIKKLFKYQLFKVSSFYVYSFVSIDVFSSVDNAINEDCPINKFMDGNVCKGILKKTKPIQKNGFSNINLLFFQ